jgi:hypothetical protein
MALTVDPEHARKLLEAAWDQIDAAISAPPEVLNTLQEILTAKDVTYKYILITGLLGKRSNARVHPRALQARSSLAGAYDARSLCHGVVVSFEKTKGNLFGLSNEPFLNKPARHPEHDKDNPQLKNKRLARLTHDLLEAVHTAGSSQVQSMLVSALRIARDQMSTPVTASIEVQLNYRRVVNFVRTFLEDTNGGSRLVAVAGTFLTLLNPNGTVKVYPPSYADKFARTVGDIEVYSAEALVSAWECKHRPLTPDDIHHGIKKAKDRGIPEYAFVHAAGFAPGGETAIVGAIEAASNELDVLLLDIHTAAPFWAMSLNPLRRSTFGATILTVLRDQMKRPGVAKRAAELWNSLE